MKYIRSFFKSRMAVGILLLLIQVAVLVLSVFKLSEYFVYAYVFFLILSIAVLCKLILSNSNPAFKLAWAILILVFPVMGGVLYALFGSDSTSTRKFSKKFNAVSTTLSRKLSQNPYVIEEIDKDVMPQVNYITRTARYPIYKNTTVSYYSPGEEKHKALLEELEKAQRYIFLEYFIVEEGIMWNSILDVLKRKAEQGVDVRVLYDDFGCLQTLPAGYEKRLRKMGIKCHVFNPFTPMLLIRMNNRDHRKIAVIDGHTAFTGGINLADEYINAYEKHGHWKDCAIKLHGDAVYSLTLMFLQAWQFCGGKTEDYDKFLPTLHSKTPFESDGFVAPYGDSPTDSEPVGENVYLNAISRAKKSVWLESPYLIIGNELITALKTAAKSGVDVRIITPHVPDKWYVHNVTQTYYETLIEAGVKIYEYTPGFIHSKVMICDGKIATVGTINLDFRSLYHHFECGVFMYDCSVIDEIINDYEETLKLCERITLEKTRKVSLFKRLIRVFLRLFAPLM